MRTQYKRQHLIHVCLLISKKNEKLTLIKIIIKKTEQRFLIATKIK